MGFGLCNLGIVPLRVSASEQSEMTSQLLYGESFRILESKGEWAYISTFPDAQEAWVRENQITRITEELFHSLQSPETAFSGDLVDFVSAGKELMAIPLGAALGALDYLGHRFNGTRISGIGNRSHLVQTAFLYMNAPMLHGGRTPFGIDAAGFVQMVYRLSGIMIKRKAAQQATQGESLSFIAESQPGDLVFFDNDSGEIDHVGMLLEDHHIIHVFGKVRLDRLDHSGIYNTDLRRHTHQLRVIKKLLD